MNIHFHGSTVQAHVKKSVQYYYYYFPLSLLYASLYESLEVLSVEESTPRCNKNNGSFS